ncbi:RNA-directed DNA polymerase, eukaryota, reverse transcriptase zinc-binding domain protein [Tanacetum coccineum]
MDWYKQRNKKMMIFKVEFEKAFDSVNWKYLDYVLGQFGFGEKWRNWIQECLRSARTSILVNGSPTSEFSIKRGLRQGDPMSPFLFILIMEGLHIAIEDATQSNLIKGVSFGNPGMRLSHFFYADDVILVTEWNQADMDNIIRLFNVFYLASGIRINIHKSNIYGIGVSNNDIEEMARVTGCTAGSLPFTYLSLHIGSSMKRLNHWHSLIDKFKARLSRWKTNLLSIGGRSTLVKAVLGSVGIYCMSIFKVPETIISSPERLRFKFFWGVEKDNKLIMIKWENTLASFEKGGLGFGSLKAFNLALLQKWRWRLVSNPDLLWVQVIKAIHGDEVGLSHFASNNKGVWANITDTFIHLDSKSIIPSNTLRFKVGCGSKVRFWIDNWIGDSPLYIRYNRLYRLDAHPNCTISDRFSGGEWAWHWSRPIQSGRCLDMLEALKAEIHSLSLSSDRDILCWGLSHDGSFTVGDTRKHIDDVILPTLSMATIWCNILPRKVNIFIWRMRLDRLPHRLNLSRRGLDTQSIDCPVFMQQW